MEMSSPETMIRANEPIRPLKRVEYELLASRGCFEDERVELLFGMVVPMTPIDPAHSLSSYRIRRALESRLGDRAMVFEGRPFAASDISEPEPDVLVTPNASEWESHPASAHLIVEVARSSLRRDRGAKALLYGLAEVAEYWIVNHVEGVVEVYRDRHAGEWRRPLMHKRGETVAMLAFPDVEIAISDILTPIDSGSI